ncbi:hypothetical protein BT69DRAFT_1350315 [Atractiella rhizophila]|nr:hypothetical protein BT69DRAFT_1350315 [Atractiella rhizophila]
MRNTINGAGNSIPPFESASGLDSSSHEADRRQMGLEVDTGSCTGFIANESTNDTTASPDSGNSDQTDPFFPKRRDSGSDITPPASSPDIARSAMKNDLQPGSVEEELAHAQNTQIGADATQSQEMGSSVRKSISSAPSAGPSRSGSMDPNLLDHSISSLRSVLSETRTLVEDPQTYGVDRPRCNASIAYVFDRIPQRLRIELLSAAGTYFVPGEPRRPEQEQIARAHVKVELHLKLDTISSPCPPNNGKTSDNTVSPDSGKSEQIDSFFPTRHESDSDAATTPTSPENGKAKMNAGTEPESFEDNLAAAQNTNIVPVGSQRQETATKGQIVSPTTSDGPSRSNSMDPSSSLGFSIESLQSETGTLVEAPQTNGVDRQASLASVAYIFGTMSQRLKIQLLSEAGIYFDPDKPRLPEQETIGRAYVVASREAQFRALGID